MSHLRIRYILSYTLSAVGLFSLICEDICGLYASPKDFPSQQNYKPLHDNQKLEDFYVF